MSTPSEMAMAVARSIRCMIQFVHISDDEKESTAALAIDALVAEAVAAERERCARLCDKKAHAYSNAYMGGPGSTFRPQAEVAASLADAIRAAPENLT